jgi:protocatechuate 3,4-dioxygenase beta subunit
MNKQLIVLFAGVLLLATMFAAACAPHATTVAAGTGEIHVRVTDSDNNPLWGGKVVSDSQPDGQLKLEGLTDNNGDVVFEGIKSGDYEFYVSRFNYNETYITIVVKPGQTTNTTVQMAISDPPLPSPTTTD